MPVCEKHIDRELLLQISRGDEKAFGELFHGFRDIIYSIAFKIITSEPLAEEIVLDVFLKVWLKREQLPHIEHFTAWLFTVTRNQVFSSLKQLALRRKTEEQVYLKDDAVQSSDPVLLLVDKEYQKLLQEAIARLSPQQEKVYRLIKEQGMKREEAARQLNLSPETVKRHLADAMQLIRGHCLSKAELYTALVVIRQLL